MKTFTFANCIYWKHKAQIFSSHHLHHWGHRKQQKAEIQNTEISLAKIQAQANKQTNKQRSMQFCFLMLPLLSYKHRASQLVCRYTLMCAKGLHVCQDSDGYNPQGFWVGPGAQVCPSFRSLLEEAFFFIFHPSVLYKCYFQ